MPEYSEKADAPTPGATPEPMSDEDVRIALKNMIQDAEEFIETVISPQREQAAKYYNAEPFGNEEEGRSKVVLTEVRDVVSSIMPSVMRIFWGPERRVEFLPTNKLDVKQAEQETDYISDVVMVTDNPGFLYTYMWFKDSFVKTTGIVKWWWDATVETKTDFIENASEEQLALLLSEDGVELVTATPKDLTIEGVKQRVYDAEFTRTAPDGRARFMPLPPEEFGFSRGARTMEQADIVYHVSQKTTTELLAMGISQADIDEFGGKTDRFVTNAEATQRDPTLQVPVTPSGPPENKEGFGPLDRHDYWETYPKLDANGDGKAELRKVCLLGPEKHIVENVPADERPFAMIVPDPEPHTMLGLSLFDYIGDLQRISSFIFRGVLDSLTAHLNPRYEAVEDQVSIPDLLNHQLGQPVRVKQPNMVRALEIPFVGADALPVLEFVQSIKENRVGVTKAAAGLNPDALQSSTKAAVAATVTAAQQRIEMFARLFAETGFKDLMRGLRRLVVKHQPRARIVKLRGEYVEVDPRTWDTDRGITTHVALGLGFTEDKLSTLGAIAADQKDWLLKLGPTNPLVTLGQYRATMARILKLQGFPDASEFYLDIPVDFQPPPAPPQQAPDPALLVAQVEAQKAQAEIQKMGADHELKQSEAASKAQLEGARLVQERQIAEMEDERERDKLAVEANLKRYELELKYHATLAEAKLKAETDRAKQQAESSKPKSEGESKPSIAVHLPETLKIPAPQVHVPAPVVHVPEPKVTVNVPEPKKGKRRRKATARKNADGSIAIESEEEE